LFNQHEKGQCHIICQTVMPLSRNLTSSTQHIVDAKLLYQLIVQHLQPSRNQPSTSCTHKSQGCVYVWFQCKPTHTISRL